MDANVTRGNLKNLVTDKPSPITVGLAQKSDADGLFKLMDANVTRGNLKNLVTDKPSPITVGLLQLESDISIDSKKKSVNLFNPAPGLKRASDDYSMPQISTLLQETEQPQKERRLTDIGDFIQLDGVPIFVNPESTIYSNTQAATNFGFIDVPVGLDEVSFLQQQHQAHLRAQARGIDDDEDEDEEIQRMRRQQSNGMYGQNKLARY